MNGSKGRRKVKENVLIQGGMKEGSGETIGFGKYTKAETVHNSIRLLTGLNIYYEEDDSACQWVGLLTEGTSGTSGTSSTTQVDLPKCINPVPKKSKAKYHDAPNRIERTNAVAAQDRG